jgi:imidazolonepropionase-like amidohydrolase
MRRLPGSLLLAALVLPFSAVAGEDPGPSTRLEFDAAGRRAVEPTVEGPALTVVLADAVVWTADGGIFERGYVVLKDGRILAVGEGDAPAVPGATVLDLTGRFITPGLIDTHSHLGVYPSPGASAHGDGNESTSPTTPGVWAEHSVWPQDPGLQRAVAGGVTTIQVLPGSANLIGGRGVVLAMVPQRGSRAMRFPGAPETVKMACGENPKRVYGSQGGPKTRMGNVRGHREAFLGAQHALREWQDWEADVEEYRTKGAGRKKKKKDDKEPKPPERSLDTETLMGILEGEILTQVHCYRADDMISILQLADEFGFSIRSFHHALEAYKIRDLLAERDVASSTWADWWGFKLEAFDGIPHNAALLTEAGARAIIHSDSWIGIQRLNQEAGKAYWTGRHAGIELGVDDAIRWITANPAWALGIEGATGTLTVDKRADVTVWNGHPFSVYTSAELVFVHGRLRYDRVRPGLWSDFEIGQGVDR